MLNKYQKVYRNLAVIEIRLLRSPHPNTVCFFASKNVSGGHGLCQWCNQDSFDASSTRIRIFVKTDIFSSHLQDPETMPFVILAIYICIYIYILPTDKSALLLSVVRIFSLRFPKSMYPYLTYSNCFRPFWRNAKTRDSPGMTYDIIVRPHARNDNRAFSKTCDFGARKRRSHGDGRLKRRKKILKKKVW